MRLEQLTYFVEAVSRGSISAASEALFVSHQNVSKSLRQLEDELGLKLLKRTRSGVYLTTEGEPIYQYAKNALQNIDLIKETANITNFFQPLDTSLSGQITITTSSVFSYFFTNVIKTVNRLYPNIIISCNILEPAHIFSLLSSGEITSDIYFLSIENTDADISTLESIGNFSILKEDRLIAIIKNTSQLASYKTCSLKTLSEYPLAFYCSSYSVTPLFLSLLQKNTTVIPKRCYKSNSTDVIEDYLFSGAVASVTTSLIKKKPLNTTETQYSYIPLTDKIPILHAGLLPHKTRKTKILETVLEIINISCPETKLHPLLFN